ncbi:AMP-binding protein [Mycobacterium sp. TNTM28]|uniref:AMP-binding protein n=1 Tax=[Mycobacterium] fortunisiensis TaxID=2600579 RepID=A0ABS6KPH9_9MYCO|nr:AMP-binding protein [[Mycobacterium] fortunisiensis]
MYAEDRQFRECLPRPEVSAALSADGLGLAAIIGTVMRAYSGRPALVRRWPTPRTVSYRALWIRINAIAAQWRHDYQFPVLPGDFVCTLGVASADHLTVDLACALAGAVTVPAPCGAAPAQLAQILDETRAPVLAVSADLLSTAVAAALAEPAVRRIIVFDRSPDPDVARNTLAAARVRATAARHPVVLEYLDEVIRRGCRLPPVPAPAADPDRLVGLYYTSGSTGRPKAAMYTERMVAGTWRNPVAVPVISYNYLPMSHYGGKALALTTLASGGTAHFAATSDMSSLFDDLTAVRPTVLPLIPRVSELIFSRYQHEYDRRLTPDTDPATLRAQVMSELRETVLGGRLLLAASGSAPLSTELATFLESCLGVHLSIGYGTTETGNILHDGRVVRPPVTDYKLLDVPELGYYGTDRPYPRGELLVKSENLSPGYYRRPESTAGSFDADGYYRTGDIMAEIAPDQLEFVERRTNVVKLSQGEFVALSQLESVFVASPRIRQIFVYADSAQAFVLAVVVPEPHAGTAAIVQSLRRIAREQRLRPYEVPRDILIETQPFSVDNGLLTATGKLARPALTDRYRDRLDQLYAAIADRRQHELAALRRGTANPTETVCRAARAVLGIPGLSCDTVPADVGVDSLTALSLATLLSELFGVDVAAADVLAPTRSLGGLATLVCSRRGASGRPRGTGPARDTDRVRARDLTLDRFIEPGILGRATTGLGLPTDAPRTVLLTGANGFLGRVLCTEWLRRLAPTGGRLICLVRGADNDDARHRMTLEPWSRADSGLEVLAGDLTRAALGLDRATWSRLAATVDLIVHPGALVNHLLPYSELFAPNVAGTAEVVRLAITDRLKPMAFVSTAAAGTTDYGRPLAEHIDIRAGCPARTRTAAPANGYLLSKWAGEVLLREAHDRCGLPVTVLRPSMILAHSRFRDYLNIDDVFTRLILSVAATGIAPRSFYRHPATRPHYDGLPVDVVAATIVELAWPAGPAGTFATHNIVNHHDDAISLDVIVDWLTEAGPPITRIASHRDWVTRLDTALRALPPRPRRHCLLPLLAAFSEPAEAVAGSAFPSQRRPVPRLTPQLIGGYLDALRHRGLL